MSSTSSSAKTEQITDTATQGPASSTIPFPCGKGFVLSVGLPPPKPKGRKKPKKSGGISQEHGKWTCYVGRHPVTRQKIRLYGFATAEEARHAQAVARAAQSQIQSAGEALSGPEQADAAQALEILAKGKLATPGILVRAAEEYLARHPQASPTTVRKFFDDWLAAKTEKGCRKKTIRSARSNLQPFLEQCGERHLTDITLSDVRAAVGAPISKSGAPVPDTNGKPIPVSLRTKTNRLVVLRNFFSAAAKNKLIGKGDDNNPTSALDKPIVTLPLPTPFTVAEAAKLLAWAWETTAVQSTTTSREPTNRIRSPSSLRSGSLGPARRALSNARPHLPVPMMAA